MNDGKLKQKGKCTCIAIRFTASRSVLRRCPRIPGGKVKISAWYFASLIVTHPCVKDTSLHIHAF